MQLEYAQYKASAERKSGETAEEMETSRKNHQRQLESLQLVVESEVNAKGRFCIS